VSRDVLEVASALRYTAQQMVQVAERLEHEARAERRVLIAQVLVDARVPRREIVKAIMTRFGCGKTVAYNALTDALSRRSAA
jgi:hypothetical protein